MLSTIATTLIAAAPTNHHSWRLWSASATSMRASRHTAHISWKPRYTMLLATVKKSCTASPPGSASGCSTNSAVRSYSTGQSADTVARTIATTVAATVSRRHSGPGSLPEGKDMIVRPTRAMTSGSGHTPNQAIHSAPGTPGW